MQMYNFVIICSDDDDDYDYTVVVNTHVNGDDYHGGMMGASSFSIFIFVMEDKDEEEEGRRHKNCFQSERHEEV